jgi:hypothetical protein
MTNKVSWLQRTVWRTNIVINNPALDSLVEGDSKVIFKGAREQNEEFWQQVRYQPLTYQESKVDSTAEEVLDSKIIKKNVVDFRFTENAIFRCRSN